MTSLYIIWCAKSRCVEGENGYSTCTSHGVKVEEDRLTLNLAGKPVPRSWWWMASWPLRMSTDLQATSGIAYTATRVHLSISGHETFWHLSLICAVRTSLLGEQTSVQRRLSGVHTAHDIVRQRWMPWRTMSYDIVRYVNTAVKSMCSITATPDDIVRCRAQCEHRFTICPCLPSKFSI